MQFRFDHIGVVVSTLAVGREHLQALIDVSEWTEEFADPINQVFVQFGRDRSGVCYETIAPLGPDSPVGLALRKGNRILNHVAYLTQDLTAAEARMLHAGCTAVDKPNPAIAYGGNRIQFFVSPLRMMIELIEAFDHRHHFK